MSGTTGTVVTDSQLLTEFQDGQAAGAITPVRFRDAIVSLTSLSSKNIVYAARYGVKADGTTDDTSAWGTAFSTVSNGSLVIAPVGISIVSSITTPPGVTLMGTNARPYTGATTNGSVIKSTATAGSTPVISMSAYSTLVGLTVIGPGTDGYGNGTTRACVQWASNSCAMQDVTLTNGWNGLDANYQSVGSARFCNFQQCHTGLANPVDSHFIGNQFSSNGTGVYLSPGANHNHFTGNRFEFSAGHNVSIAGISTGKTGENTFTCNTFDRAGYNAVQMSYARHTTFVGNIFERSGANATANTNNDAHVEMDNCTTIVFSGNTSLAAQSDSATGPFSPSWGVWDGGSNSNCLIKNNIWVYHSVNGTNGGGINVTTTFSSFSTDNLVVAATAAYTP